MKKPEERTPEEIAKDLEKVEFSDIEESELKDVFGSSSLPTSINNGCC
jgi:hypothetical protein